MARRLILLFLFVPLLSFNQEFFYLGDKSYESSYECSMKSNSPRDRDDVKIRFVKGENNNKFIVVSKKYFIESYITDKLNIYLKNGNVITVNDAYKYDYFDSTMVSIYKLNDDDISKMLNAYINSIRFNHSNKSRGFIGATETASTTEDLKYNPINIQAALMKIMGLI